MLNIPRIVAGMLLSFLIGGLAYRRRSLTRGGWLGASIEGAWTMGVVMPIVAAAERGAWMLWLLPAALLGGVAGSLADSLVGATAQAIYRAPGGGETERRADHAGRPQPLLRGLRWMN